MDDLTSSPRRYDLPGCYQTTTFRRMAHMSEAEAEQKKKKGGGESALMAEHKGNPWFGSALLLRPGCRSSTDAAFPSARQRLAEGGLGWSAVPRGRLDRRRA